MATLESLAQDYARRLRASGNKYGEAQQIAREIKGITYSSTNASLTPVDRRHLLDQIYAEATGDYNFINTKSVNNIEYLQLVNYILSQL
jgi:hypothetical protein